MLLRLLSELLFRAPAGTRVQQVALSDKERQAALEEKHAENSALADDLAKAREECRYLVCNCSMPAATAELSDIQIVVGLARYHREKGEQLRKQLNEMKEDAANDRRESTDA